MSKYKAGDLVRFREKELILPSVGALSVKVDTDKVVGRIANVIDKDSKGVEYYVDIKVGGMILNVKLPESKLISLKDSVCDIVDNFAKKAIVGISERTANELNGFIAGLRVGPEISERIRNAENECKNGGYVSLLDTIRLRDFLCSKVFVPNMPFDCFGTPLPNSESADGGTGSKMSKEKCVKLLESYRAERAKVKNGRRFERCLRDGVVDEALERAIELLQEK